MRHIEVRDAFFVVLALGLLGCATKKAPERENVADALRERTGVDSAGLPESETWTAPPGTSLDDGLSYDEAVAVALWNSPDFQAALTSLGIARADLIDAGLLRNPILSLLFPWGPKQLEFALTFPLEALWQRPRRIEEAGYKADAVAEELVGHGVKLIADVRVAFLEAQAAEVALSISEEQHRAAGKLAEIAESRLRAGDISELEAHLSRADAVRLQTAWLARRATRDIAFVNLRSLIGLAEDGRTIVLSRLTDDLATECSDLPGLIKSALAARPDVRAAELSIEAAGARVGLEGRKIFTLSAILDANAEGKEGFEMGPGLATEIPLFNRNQGGRARGEAELVHASRRYLAVRNTAARDVQTAYTRMLEAKGTAAALRETMTSGLGAATEQAQKAFDAGEISMLALLETRQRLMTIDLSRLEAELATSRAVVRLEEAAGGRCRPQAPEATP